MTEPQHAIGEIFDYQSMMVVLRLRANELQINRSSDKTADLSGLPDKYFAKLLGPRPVRRIGSKTLGAVLGLLQIKFIAVVDEEAVKRYGARVQKRDDRLVRSGNVTIEFSRRHMQKIGKTGGLNGSKRMSKAALRRRAKHANFIRWDRIKAAAQGSKSSNTDCGRDQSQKAARRRDDPCRI